MNGAHALLSTLAANGATVCFANPGTTEMHLVAALDDEPATRAILCLFEGVATGAADGYARVAGRPATTLLHLGPGLANGWANLHNARRAHSPVLNIVGDHATYHGAFDPPLQSNLDALAESTGGWFRRSSRASDLARDVADALRAAYGPPGGVATLAVPADVAWGEVESTATFPRAPRADAIAVDDAALRVAVDALRTKRTALVLGGSALTRPALELALRVADATSSKLLMETFPAIMDHGAGVVSAERLIYVPEFAIAQLEEAEAVILIGAHEPVSFFAYPNVPSALSPQRAEIYELAPSGVDALSALEALVDELGAPPVSTWSPPRAEEPRGELTPLSFAQAVGATIPEGLIVADESNTTGVHLLESTHGAPTHRWMTLTGGSIGFGLPVAVGAAVASGRRVLALESDGSMMYTPQALWTMARESLDVTVVALANRSYAVLQWELARVNAIREDAPSARLLDLERPELDLAGLARSLGVPGVRVDTAQDLAAALRRSYATPGPMLIEAVVTPRPR